MFSSEPGKIIVDLIKLKCKKLIITGIHCEELIIPTKYSTKNFANSDKQPIVKAEKNTITVNLSDNTKQEFHATNIKNHSDFTYVIIPKHAGKYL